MVMIWQKIGFGPNWPHMAIEGGAKWGLKVKFSKIWLHHCSKLSKRSLPCEYGDDWAKNRIWPQLAPPGHWRGGQMGSKSQIFENLTLPLFKTSEEVPSLWIWPWSGKNRIWPCWPHLAPEGGAKLGLKVKFSKIWLHHCSKLPKRSLPCEYGNDRAKNRIWPRLAPIGTFRGAKRGLRVDFYQIWLQISK